MVNMLTFNQLLRASDIDPDLVRLVRHRDLNVQRAVFDAAMKGDPASTSTRSTRGRSR
jgi:hypothetical protein